MKQYKDDFPILQQTMHGKPLVYLDSSATAQKPLAVISALQRYYREENANIHRGIYELSARATEAYEKTRSHVQQFINAEHTHEIIFVSGTTEGINLVAQSYGRTFFKPGDEVIVSAMEHHANIVPWQILVAQTGIQLQIIPISDSGELDMIAYQNLFSPRTKMVAVTHASNVLGTINPIKEMVRIAHTHDVPVLVDGAQAFPHLPVDVKDLDCDFYVFSAHKAYGPTGLGILYGKSALLEKMPPYQGGGYMIATVSFAETTYNKLPYKFEAGTPNISAVIGFDAALHYLETIGFDVIMAHENHLLTLTLERLREIPHITVLGHAPHQLGVISFIMAGVHPHDIGTILDYEGIAVRVGHHCAMPLMQRFNVPATVRISFGLYNNEDDIASLMTGLQQVKGLFI